MFTPPTIPTMVKAKKCSICVADNLQGQMVWLGNNAALFVKQIGNFGLNKDDNEAVFHGAFDIHSKI